MAKPVDPNPEDLEGAEPLSTALPTPVDDSLEGLKSQLETQKLSREEREKLLVEAIKTQLKEETRTALSSLTEETELTDDSIEVLRNLTAYLMALALYTNTPFNSVQELIAEYRSHSDESIRFLTQVFIKILAKGETPIAKEFQLTIWDEASNDAADLVKAMEAIEQSYAKKDEEAKKKAEKKEDGKEKNWYQKHKGEVNTALIIGGLGLGVYFLANKLFKSDDPTKQVSTGAKVATTALVGAMGLGQILGFESVQKLISGGKSDSWVYRSWVKGFTSAADFEMGVAMDYWTGNGPSEAERTLFEQMALIFDVSDTRLWGTSKLGFLEFMDGKNASMLPWYQDDEERIRTSIKDYYLEDLQEALPYLQDEEAAKNVSLKQVLLDGFKLGIIEEVDNTDISDTDRAELEVRDEETEKTIEASKGYFDHPEENTDHLLILGDEMTAQLDELSGATDQYWDDTLVAFENMIGVDFDLGEDDEGEYRDLKEAREILHGFFDEAGQVDHEFFESKRGRIEAFKVFLQEHPERPWSETTKTEYEGYKSEMLELQQRILASRKRAEVANLKRMEADRSAGEIAEDASEFVVVGLSGALHRLDYRLEQLSEGNTLVWALTIGQTIGVASEFVNIDVIKREYGLKPATGFGNAIYRIGKGATWNITAKPVYKTIPLGVHGYKYNRAYKYSAEQLFEKVLRGEMSKNEVKTRATLAETYKNVYKSRWLRLFDGNIEAANTRLENIQGVKLSMNALPEIEAFVDGEPVTITEDGIRSFVENELVLKGKIPELRFYRAIKSLRESAHFNEIIAHLKEPVNTLSPDAQAAFERLNPEQRTCVRDLINQPKGQAILAELMSAPLVNERIPKHLGEETTPAGKVHRYKFGADELKLSETEIGQRSTQIADTERAAGRGPTPGHEAAWDTKNWNEAVRTLCEERFSTPRLVRPGVYRYAGNDFAVDPAEVALRRAASPGGVMTEEAAIRSICIEQGTGHLIIEEVRIRGGLHEYKVGGEWISTETPTTPAKTSEIRTAFEAEMAKSGRAFDFAKMAENAKLLKFAETVHKILGPVAAVGIIYHLETAEDKRKAICEVTAGFISFTAGYQAAKLTDARVAKYIKDPRWRLALDLGAGLAAAFGFTEPISEIMDHYFANVPASHAVSKEVGAIFEKASSRLLIRQTLQSAEKGLIKKGVEKMGLTALTVAFEHKITGNFTKKIGQLAAKKGFQQVLKALGWKGVTTAALLADDATLIGVVDDIVAVGLIVWMGFDIYDIITLIANANEVQEQMVIRQKHEIESFDIKDSKSRAAFQEKLIPFGLTIDRAHELPEDTFFDILRTLPSVRIELTRKNTLGSEVWTLNSGEAVGIAIYDQNREVLAEMSDEDATEMEEALDSMEVKDPEAAD